MKTVSSILIVFLAILSVPASAELGIIDQVNHDSAEIFVDDYAYKMALNLQVLNRDGKQASRYDLSRGDKVYFELNAVGQLGVIRVLPPETDEQLLRVNSGWRKP